MTYFKTLHKKQNAFTMIELVMVIVVLGILAALALPRIDRDSRQEAGDNILSAIRYTQHLALNDDKTNPSDANWQRQLWKIQFTASTNNLATLYTISSDTNPTDNSVQKIETAIDPSNGKYMFNTSGATVGLDSDESPNIFIGKNYGIIGITMGGGCTAQHLAFDQLGRLYNSIGAANNDYASYVKTNDCTMSFTFEDGSPNLIIIITKETGYAYIQGQLES